MTEQELLWWTEFIKKRLPNIYTTTKIRKAVIEQKIIQAVALKDIDKKPFPNRCIARAISVTYQITYRQAYKYVISMTKKMKSSPPA